MRILITGVTGFAGGHLAEALLTQKEVQLLGISRREEWPQHWQHLAACVVLRKGDVSDGPWLEAILREFQPEQLYHLAGYAHAGQSLHHADAAWQDNLTATRRLYEAVHRWGGACRIVYVGSGLVYGEADSSQSAYDETCPMRPPNPYATSKAATDLLSYQYTRFPGLDIVRVRPFNHIGPHQSPQYAVAHFAQQIAAIERGERQAILETGNLKSQRDLTDVRDMVASYILLMKRGRCGEAYNAASGEVHSIQEVLDRLLRLARVPIEVRQKADLLRASDSTVLRGDAAKLRRETGWTPRFRLDETLADTLAYWRQAR